MTALPRILVLADDLTGAIECGAQLARRGIPAPVHIRPLTDSNDSPGPSLPSVLNCRSRHLAPGIAAEAIASQLACKFDPPSLFVYKKTDSTLRGNLGSELEALSRSAPESPIIYAPAYPRLGRICRNGILYLNGVPLAETEFSRELSQPSHGNSILRLLSQQSSLPAVLVRRPHHLSALLESGAAGTLLVCDAEADEELEELAKAATSSLAPWFLAGPAAFLGAVLRTLGNQCSPLLKVQSAGKFLWICGSLHSRSQDQIKEAAKMGIPVSTLPPLFAGPDDSNPHFFPRGFAKMLAMQLRENRHLVLSGPSSGHTGAAASTSPPAINPAISRTLGMMAAEIFKEEYPDVLGICGGDTAEEVLDALGVTTIYPLGEIFDGIPISKIQCRDRNLLLITKAGGFGPVDLMASLNPAGSL